MKYALIGAILLAAATAAWSQPGLEGDLDGNARVFEVVAEYPKAPRKAQPKSSTEAVQQRVPDSLNPGAHESLAHVVPAKGVQIYECREGQWAFVAPEADLFDAAGKKIGTHYAGPHWEAADGSKIVGKVTARADAPAAGAIPWLLLGTKSVGGEGAFSRVTNIQRVSTVGGIAPAGACSEAGARARIPYTADYYFFAPK